MKLICVTYTDFGLIVHKWPLCWRFKYNVFFELKTRLSLNSRHRKLFHELFGHLKFMRSFQTIASLSFLNRNSFVKVKWHISKAKGICIFENVKEKFSSFCLASWKCYEKHIFYYFFVFSHLSNIFSTTFSFWCFGLLSFNSLEGIAWYSWSQTINFLLTNPLLEKLSYL